MRLSKPRVCTVSPIILLTLAEVTCLCAAELLDASAGISSPYVAGEIVVRLKDPPTRNMRSVPAGVTSGDKTLADLQRTYGLVLSEQNAEAASQGKTLRLKQRMPVRPLYDLCAALARDDNVALAQPNYIYRICRDPNDPEFADQYAHQLIQLTDAWNFSTGSHDVVVAVLDTGVDVDHPDLRGNIWVNPGEIPDNGIDDDENGFVDDVHGWNFEDNNNQVRPEEDPFAFFGSVANHGTMVSGVIAGVGDNGEGVTGVNWQCSVMALRLSIFMTTVEIAAALDYAVANGAHIANMSFGSEEFGPRGDLLVQEAIDRADAAGVLLVASAGNSDNTMPNYPAAYPNVMAVASTDGEDIKTGHSSFGPWVDIAAPGTDIVTTDWGGEKAYVATAGTSFSGPYVAAVGALLLAHDPTLTHREVRAILENTTDPIHYGNVDPARGYIGTGRVNAYRALQEAGRPLPLGEIAQPRMNESLPREGNDLDLLLLMQGEHYAVDFTTYGDEDWVPVSDGAVSTDANGLARVTMANPGAGTYTLRLTVTGDEAVHRDVKDFAIAPFSSQAHWPKPEATGALPGFTFNSSPLCVDFNGDGSNEIIQSSVAFDFDFDFEDIFSPTPLGQIDVWGADGNALPGWPRDVFTIFGGNIMTAVGDIDGDGAFELIVVDDFYLTVEAYRSDGDPVEGLWPIEVGPWWAFIASDPVLADLDQDGDSEIIVALDSESSSDDGLFAIQGDGSILWDRRYTSQGPLSVADLDGDGDVEIALSGFGPGITNVHTFLLDHQGQQVNRWRGGSPKGTVISDLEGDGSQEILFCTENDVQAVHANGSVVWRTEVFEPMDTDGEMSVGDLDADGHREVYVTSLVEANGFRYTQVYGFDHSGRLLEEQGYPKVLMGEAFRTVPLIADVDADGDGELLVAAGAAPTVAWEADGTMTPGFPLLDPLHALYTAPAIKDLDQDGDLELMILGTDIRLHVLDLGSQSLPASVDWGQVRHDPQNTGWTAPPLEMNAIFAPAQVGPGEQLVIQPTVSGPPNPLLKFAVGGLPEGAVFETDTHTVFWQPSIDQAFQSYSIHFGVSDGIRQDSRSVSIAVVADALYYAGMTEDPDWRLVAGWAWGRPTGGGSGNGDPKGAFTGDFVIGNNPDGDYENNLRRPVRATTRAISCVGHRNIRLMFRRWLGVDAPHDRATIEVSNDGGTWTLLWSTGTDPIFDEQWQLMKYDVPADVADDQPTVYFRWGLGPSNDSGSYPGWNIDDVMVTGEPLE